MARMMGVSGMAGTRCSPRCRRTHKPSVKRDNKAQRAYEKREWMKEGRNMSDPGFTYARNLQEGDVIDIGDPTENPVPVTVEYVSLLYGTWKVFTKELSFPLHMLGGDQVTYFLETGE